MSPPPPPVVRPRRPMSSISPPPAPNASVASLPRARSRTTTRSRSSRPSTTEGNRPFPPSKMPAPLLSETEYAALPESVQRKYFSSLERLRIERSAQPAVEVACLPRRPQTARSSQRSNSQSRSQSRGRRRLRKLSTVNDITEEEAQWFLSLPDKIIKTYLSREEAILLAGRCETFLLDSDSTSELHKEPEISALPLQEKRRSRSFQADSIAEADFSVQESPDLSIDMPPPRRSTSRPNTDQRRASFRRTMSLSNTFTRLSTSSAPPLPSPLNFPPTPQSAKRPRAATSNVATPRYNGDVEPETKHYQDPEARMKLRLYLASPHKFDEVVEYGFPSDKQPESSPEPSSQEQDYERQASRDFQTFLRDDSVSFLDHSDTGDESSEESSLADLDTPVTPLDPDDGFRAAAAAAQIPKSNYSSFDSNGLPTLQSRPKRPQEVLPHGLPANREMTLRMTLTRPDLRADDELLYGWQHHKSSEFNPMALQELPPETNDNTGMHGPFAVQPNRQGNLVRKLLGKVKKGKQ